MKFFKCFSIIYNIIWLKDTDPNIMNLGILTAVFTNRDYLHKMKKFKVWEMNITIEIDSIIVSIVENRHFLVVLVLLCGQKWGWNNVCILVLIKCTSIRFSWYSFTFFMIFKVEDFVPIGKSIKGIRLSVDCSTKLESNWSHKSTNSQRTKPICPTKHKSRIQFTQPNSSPEICKYAI